MAVYQKKFENVYEKNLTSNIDGVETVDVTQATIFNYKAGLTIDAQGQTFYRNASKVEITTPKHTREYQKSETYAGMQAGYATINFQANMTNLAVAGLKTETSTSYNLAGGIFVNPSPIKLKRAGVKPRSHPRIAEAHLVLLKNSRNQKEQTKLGTVIYRLHMWGL